ncbi:hypothetical protein GCM10027355_26560 [Haloplanus salinarum]
MGIDNLDMVPSIVTSHARSAAARTGSAVRAAAFWSAVVLPFVAVVLLALGAPLSWIGLLILGNAAAFVVSHDYRTNPNRER